jgi:hypothetical protein
LSQSHNADVAIIGAGPYGLSLAAHLAAAGVPFRIFGRPMQTWREHMPVGMSLKSEGFASNLSDPAGALSLERYCAERGLPYAHTSLPVPLATFRAYGLEFQRRFAPDLIQSDVVALTRNGPDFAVRLEDNQTVQCHRVVVAVGITHFAAMPAELKDLSSALVTHSGAHNAFDQFSGRTIAVIGAGASAVDIAVLAHKAGARVHLVTRRARVEFHHPPAPRSLAARLRRPETGLGPSWKSWFYTSMPFAFHALPERMRQRLVRTHLPPAGCWFTQEEFVANATVHSRTRIAEAAAVGAQVTLTLAQGDGSLQALRVDHVIAATGYRPDIGRLPFLDPALASAIAVCNGSPVLSTNFESSARGLHFIGLAAANSFGPMLRFTYGAAFAAKRLSRHFERSPPMTAR